MSDTFPRQYARTQRFTLGEPRNLSVVADDTVLLFLRSNSGSDPVNRLWKIDLATEVETLLADPVALLGDDDDDLPAEERARRERARESAGGITGYATDSAGSVAVFALAGRLWATDIAAAVTAEVAVEGPVFDPRPSPDGTCIAYVCGPELRVVDRAGRPIATIAEPPGAGSSTVAWGSADFVAAEEMHRFRGFWFSPDSSSVAVCRVDEADVPIWHIADPANPAAEPREIRYPAAGTTNPQVDLYVCALDGSGDRIRVDIDRDTLPYLADVTWTSSGLAAVGQARDQRRVTTARVDASSGATTTVAEDTDDRWVELVPGGGQIVGDGVPVTCADRDGARRLMVGGTPVSPPDVQVRRIVTARDGDVVVVGNPLADSTVQHAYRWRSGTDGTAFEQLTHDDGVHNIVVGKAVCIIGSSRLDTPGSTWALPSGRTITSCAETPLVTPNVHISRTTNSDLAVAVVLPHNHDGSPLPVLLDPYGGPHAQRVVSTYAAYCTSQWFADQGFAVVIVDGRGTPGRGTEFERAVFHDLAAGVLDDQVEGLQHAVELHPELDLTRVGIRGWSFGGYLAALAVLQRPDVFHSAIAGAPVTEWRLYDTHYTERYLGDPNELPDVYDANSLIPLAPLLTRPLLLVHGLADDNVVAAHTLQLSSALLAAGRPHEVLPLVGVTHMTPQEVVAENLLLHQLSFLRRTLAMTTVG
ncbi:MAG TPA: prolyl oligopeptidase family serine peptidase [Ilumatobacter sp.]|nr:prolyl oligopeptidase family serine peptidase [Ilumatobacter sp.]